MVDFSADRGTRNDRDFHRVFDKKHGGGEGVSRASGARQAHPGDIGAEPVLLTNPS